MKLRSQIVLLALMVTLLGADLAASQAREPPMVGPTIGGSGLHRLPFINGSFGQTGQENIDVRGQVTSLKAIEKQDETGQLGIILVEGKKENDTNYSRAALTITKQTRFFIHRGEKCIKANFAALRLGQQVEAFIVEPALKSKPIRGAASEVTILESLQ